MSPNPGGSVASESAGPWVRSSYSGPQGNCVEVARLPGGTVAVRNSRHPDGPALVFTDAEWQAFLSGAADGEFGSPG